MSGWICLHRKIRNHWIFRNPEDFKAFVTMLMEVNHAPKKVTIKGVVLDVQRGQSVNSLGTWASVIGMGWDKSKVRRFFKLLEADKIIKRKTSDIVPSKSDVNQKTTRKTTHKTTHITICNYDSYQLERTANDTQNDTKQQYSNIELENLVGKSDVFLDKKFLELWNDYIEFRNLKKYANTDKALKISLNKLKAMTLNNAIKSLEQTIEREYRGIFEVKTNSFKSKELTLQDEREFKLLWKEIDRQAELMSTPESNGCFRDYCIDFLGGLADLQAKTHFDFNRLEDKLRKNYLELRDEYSIRNPSAK